MVGAWLGKWRERGGKWPMGGRREKKSGWPASSAKIEEEKGLLLVGDWEMDLKAQLK
jgi:hypothetical protein